MEQLHIQPSEIDALEYWRLELMVDVYGEILEERKKKEGEQQADMEKKYQNPNVNPSQYKQPKMPTYQQPKFTIPKIPGIKF